MTLRARTQYIFFCSARNIAEFLFYQILRSVYPLAESKTKSVIELVEPVIELMEPLVIQEATDINFLDILNDYKTLFNGKRVSIETNYKKISNFKVHFNTRDLPHLMGWDKIVDKKSNATNLIKFVSKESLTLETSKNHRKFHEAKNRMLNYNFIHDIFIHKNVNVCVMTSDMKPNPQRLDIVFYREKQHEAVMLGLRKEEKMGYFVPTTLHTPKLQNNYNGRRRTSIKTIDWE